MQIEFLKFIKNLFSLFLVTMSIYSCSHQSYYEDDTFTERPTPETKLKIACTKLDEIQGVWNEYDRGELPCLVYKIKVSKSEFLKISFLEINKEAEDIYDRGYQILERIKKYKVVETIKLRRDEDAYWNLVPFVRIRKQKYLADLDGDGILEFAVFPFSPGSAVWGTVRIFSLKNKIEYWGEGRYQFEDDTFVQLNCMKCSKFNLNACKTCE